MKFELHQTGLDVLITERGDDWECRIYRLGLVPEIRFYSVLHNRPDKGLLIVSQKLRRDFGITGTYKPTE